MGGERGPGESEEPEKRIDMPEGTTEWSPSEADRQALMGDLTRQEQDSRIDSVRRATRALRIEAARSQLQAATVTDNPAQKPTTAEASQGAAADRQAQAPEAPSKQPLKEKWKSFWKGGGSADNKPPAGAPEVPAAIDARAMAPADFPARPDRAPAAPNVPEAQPQQQPAQPETSLEPSPEAEAETSLGRDAELFMEMIKNGPGGSGVYNRAPETTDEMLKQLKSKGIIPDEPAAILTNTYEMKRKRPDDLMKVVHNAWERQNSSDIAASGGSIARIALYPVKGHPDAALALRLDRDGEHQKYKIAGWAALVTSEDEDEPGKPAAAFDYNQKNKKFRPTDALREALADSRIENASVSYTINPVEPLPTLRVGPGPKPGPDYGSGWSKAAREQAEERTRRMEAERDAENPPPANPPSDHPPQPDKAPRVPPMPARSPRGQVNVPSMPDNPPQVPPQPDRAPNPEVPEHAKIFSVGQEITVPTTDGPEPDWKVRSVSDLNQAGERIITAYKIDSEGKLQLQEISNTALAKYQQATEAPEPPPIRGAENKEYSAQPHEAGERAKFSQFIDKARREQSRAGASVIDLEPNGEFTPEQIKTLKDLAPGHDDRMTVLDEIDYRNKLNTYSGRDTKEDRTEFSRFIDKLRRERAFAGTEDVKVVPEGPLTNEQLKALEGYATTPEELSAVREEVFQRGRMPEHSALTGGEEGARSAFSEIVDKARQTNIKRSRYDFNVDPSGDLSAEQIQQLLENASPEQIDTVKNEIYLRGTQKEYSSLHPANAAERSAFSELVDKASRAKIDLGDYDFYRETKGELRPEQIEDLKKFAGSRAELNRIYDEVAARIEKTPHSLSDAEGKRTEFSKLVDKARLNKIRAGEYDFDISPTEFPTPEQIEALKASVGDEDPKDKEKILKGLYDELLARRRKDEYSARGHSAERSKFSKFVDKVNLQRIEDGDYDFGVSRAGQMTADQVSKLAERADAEDLKELRMEIEYRDKQLLKDKELFPGALPAKERFALEAIVNKREAVLREEARKKEKAEKEKPEAPKGGGTKAAGGSALPAKPAGGSTGAGPEKPVRVEKLPKDEKLPKAEPDGEEDQDYDEYVQAGEDALDKLAEGMRAEWAKTKAELPEAQDAEKAALEPGTKGRDGKRKELPEIYAKPLAKAKSLKELKRIKSPFEEPERERALAERKTPRIEPKYERPAGPRRAEAAPGPSGTGNGMIEEGEPAAAPAPEARSQTAQELFDDIQRISAEEAVGNTDIGALLDRAVEDGFIKYTYSEGEVPESAGTPEANQILDGIKALYERQTAEYVAYANELVETIKNSRTISEAAAKEEAINQAVEDAIEAGLAQPDPNGIFGLTDPDNETAASREFMDGLRALGQAGDDDDEDEESEPEAEPGERPLSIEEARARLRGNQGDDKR